MDDNSPTEFGDKDVEELARDIVRIERLCFYGDEPERGRLKKIREILNKEILKSQ